MFQKFLKVQTSENTITQRRCYPLRTHWTDLVIASYRIDSAILTPLVPPGTTLDTWNGDCYVSVVAFQFSNTRIAGVPAPVYRSFPEINLRFYVTRNIDGELRRGVVFVKEIIPCRGPAVLARTFFKENFHTLPVTPRVDDYSISYTIGKQRNQHVKVRCTDSEHTPLPGSLDHHLLIREWAYRTAPNGKGSSEFHVSHPQWDARTVVGSDVQLDIASLYGHRWADAMDAQPASVIAARGGPVAVTLPAKMNHH